MAAAGTRQCYWTRTPFDGRTVFVNYRRRSTREEAPDGIDGAGEAAVARVAG